MKKSARAAKAAALPPPMAKARTSAAARDDSIAVSRTSLALLVEGVLAGEAPITPALRSALREATSHGLPF